MRLAVIILIFLLALLVVPAFAYGTADGNISERFLTVYDPGATNYYQGQAFFKDDNYMYACGGMYGSYVTINNTKCFRGDTTSTLYPALDNPTKSNGGLVYSGFAEYHDKWYMVGGYNHTAGATHTFYVYNNTWTSSDHGNTWVQVNRSCAFQPRAAARLVVFNDRLYMVGGINYTSSYKVEPRNLWAYTDVWWLDSANESAAIWTRATANDGMPARTGHTLAVIGDKMWVFGGASTIDVSYAGWYADGWYSTDGATWTKAWEDWTDRDLYGPGFSKWTNRDGTDVWIMGGGYRNVSGSPAMNTKVLATTNGASWWIVNSSSTMQAAGLSYFMWLTNWTPPATATTNPVQGLEGLYYVGVFNTYWYSRISLETQVASATPATSSGTAPFAVGWNDATTGYGSSWIWDFKDGYFSYERNASHVFTSSGSYPVLFTVESYFGTSEATLNVSVSTAQSQVQYYTQHQVRLRALDSFGTPLPRVNITVSYVGSSLPNTNLTWLTAAFGISPTVAQEMVDSSLVMQGWTGTDGSITAMMFPSIEYGVRLINTTLGIDNYVKIFPTDSDYGIYVMPASQLAQNQTYMQMQNTTLYITEPTASTVTFNLIYWDPAGLTTSLTFNVTAWDNKTPMYYITFLPGTSVVMDSNYTVPNVKGQEWRFWWNATRSAPF